MQLSKSDDDDDDDGAITCSDPGKKSARTQRESLSLEKICKGGVGGEKGEQKPACLVGAVYHTCA